MLEKRQGGQGKDEHEEEKDGNLNEKTWSPTISTVEQKTGIQFWEF